MTMSDFEPYDVLQIALLVWLGLFAALIAAKLLNGEIATAGLLRASVDGPIDPARVQLLLSTLVAASVFATHALTARDDGGLESASGAVARFLESPDTAILALVGGSNVIYLLAKKYLPPAI